MKDKMNHPINWETQPVTLTFTLLENAYLILLGPGQALGQVSRLSDLDFEEKNKIKIKINPSCCTVAMGIPLPCSMSFILYLDSVIS